MKNSIVVVGSLNMDFVVQVPELPAPGQTTLGSGFRMIPGGKGANQACAAAKLVSSATIVRMIGRVGYDLFADHLKASLAAAGVDVSAVHGTREQATGIAMIWVDSRGQNSIIVAPGANMLLAASAVEAMRPLMRSAHLALFQLETPLDTVERALLLACKEGARTILDPAPAQRLPASLLAAIDILTPNETEACILLELAPSRVSAAEAPEVARALLALGPKAVVVKLGEQGCFYADGTLSIHSPAFPVDVKDTTAAGDTFNAGLAVALAEGMAIPAALRFANAAASISATKIGAQTSAPGRAEVDAALLR